VHGFLGDKKLTSAVGTISVSRAVSPAECFLSPRIFDVVAIQKFSSAAVLHPKPDTYFADIQHV
jgi:hypothetical protein